MNIDWALLRQQKIHLLEVIEYLGDTEMTPTHKDSLEGIVHLIDSIQDSAVDEEGYDEDEVFALETEEV